MDTLSYKTQSANNESVVHDWYIIDAENQTLGRMCTRIASVLRGKHKPSFTPHVDCGDNVIVINADKVRLTGKKLTDRVYLRHSGYPGGQKATTPERLLMSKHPERVIEKAVKGMLPKNPLGRAMYRKLFVYAGAEHKHGAQQPKPLNI